MATLLDTPLELPEPDYRNWNMATDPHEVAFKKLQDAAADLPATQVRGRLLRWQRGDGYAWYLVTKERPLTLQWVRYGDNWQVEYALIRGLNLADVRQMVQSELALRALFAKKEG